jgi:DNA-binding transcriptional LysR family regulator
MHATFRQLQLFVALAEKGSITAAARACHVTQPTVSMQIKELAESIGLPLYAIHARRLVLTPAGEAVLETARAMSDDWAALEQKIANLKGLTHGRLRLAVVSTAKYFVPAMLGKFCAAHPDVDIALQVLNRDGVVARLRESRDDLYIMSMPPGDIPLERRIFMANPLVVIAPRTHALAGKRSVPIERLARERFILRELGSGTRMACDAHLVQLGFRPDVRLELGSNEAIKQAVAAGLGLAIVSRHALGAHPSSDIVAELPVRGFPIHASWYVLWRHPHRMSPIAREFLSHITIEAAAGHRPPGPQTESRDRRR